MREIKFRGKCIPEFPHPVAKWVYGSFVSDKLILSPYKERNENRHFWYMVDPDTVGQFTGLLDSNGKEIYEGDILRFAPPWRWEEDERRNGVVVYKCYGFRIEYSDTSEALFNLAANDAPYTIIGNIYDNPGLLEAKNARD